MGHWYDDNEFLERIRLICNVQLIEEKSNPFVIHLFHKSSNTGSPDAGIGAEQQEIDNNPLIQRNKKLFENLMGKIKNNSNNPNWLDIKNAKEDCISYYGKIHFHKNNFLFDIDYFRSICIDEK